MRIVTVIPQDSPWLAPPTPRQGQSIAKFAQILKIKEPIEYWPTTRWEARALIYELLMATRLRRKRESQKNRTIQS
jgi:hypothetical protein